MAASLAALPSMVNILPGMNAGASTYAVPSPIKGSGTAWVLLGFWALSPARPTPIHPRHECRGLSALFGVVLFQCLPFGGQNAARGRSVVPPYPPPRPNNRDPTGN